MFTAPDPFEHVRAHGVMNEIAGRRVAVPGRGQRRQPLQIAGHAVIAVL